MNPKNKVLYLVTSLIIMIVSVVLILVWFNWKLLVVLVLFGWSMNLNNKVEDL